MLPKIQLLWDAKALSFGLGKHYILTYRQTTLIGQLYSEDEGTTTFRNIKHICRETRRNIPEELNLQLQCRSFLKFVATISRDILRKGITVWAKSILHNEKPCGTIMPDRPAVIFQKFIVFHAGTPKIIFHIRTKTIRKKNREAVDSTRRLRQ
jgi:hypothetical protein